MRNLIIWAALYALFSPLPLHAAEDSLTNLVSPAQPSTLSPGAVILLPDGGQSVILSALPNGDLLTDLGLVISPEGLIRDGEFKGRSVRLDPELIVTESPDGARPEDLAQPRIGKPKAVAPAPATPIPETPRPASQARTVKKPDAEAPVPKNTRPSGKLTPEEEKALSLAQMLPLTHIAEDKKAETHKPGTQAPPPPQEKKNIPPKAAEKARTQPPAAKEPEPRKAKKAEVKPVATRQKPGEPLRIPPDAAKTGNLSFLEGCWQGTRPEYYSKRTIKECFCFGANGGNGKRRIFDGPQRMCIGGSKAHLSSNGVLSVTSNGAACNDGERWGSAEMICRNSGPRTPCSWVFKDANNGRQSYEIPFVRVESCGR